MNLVAKPCSGINDSYLPVTDEFRYISGMGHLLGYARVSTGDQDVALQRDALTAAGCYRVFVDTASGALDARPALTEVLDQLGRRTPWWCGDWTGWAAQFGIPSTSSPTWKPAESGSGR